MNKEFLLIAITRPDFRPDEGTEIVELLENGFDRVHIRKPERSADEVAALLSEIPCEYFPRLSLHQTPEVIGKFESGGLLGFQINSRYPEIPSGISTVSVSCHSLDEAKVASGDPRISYQTLSPVFDSISKRGYWSRFPKEKLRDLPPNTIALGGVSPDRFELLRSVGFAGAALLGWVWDMIDRDGFAGLREQLAFR